MFGSSLTVILLSICKEMKDFISNTIKIRSIKLPCMIWGSAVDAQTNSLILDVRDESRQVIRYQRIYLDSLKIGELALKGINWWSRVVGCENELLYITVYLDRKDPNLQETWSLNVNSGKKALVDAIPEFQGTILYPSVYEIESEYHKMVADFLQKELPLPSEYLEFDDKIILTYYLRSDKGFDRFLVLLKQGKYICTEKTDQQMNGFSSGSFFVYNSLLIFFKNRNEVCCCPI